MGADLYINEVYRKTEAKYSPLFNDAVKKRNNAKNEIEKAKFQKEVDTCYNLMQGEGYFRDSYNSTSILNRLEISEGDGLSWWRDITPLQDKQGNIKNEKLIDFLNLVLAADLRLPTRQDLLNDHAQVDEQGENSVEGWHLYYLEKRQKLIDFIVLAIETDQLIYASL